MMFKLRLLLEEPQAVELLQVEWMNKPLLGLWCLSNNYYRSGWHKQPQAMSTVGVYPVISLWERPMELLLQHCPQAGHSALGVSRGGSAGTKGKSLLVCHGLVWVPLPTEGKWGSPEPVGTDTQTGSLFLSTQICPRVPGSSQFLCMPLKHAECLMLKAGLVLLLMKSLVMLPLTVIGAGPGLQLTGIMFPEILARPWVAECHMVSLPIPVSSGAVYVEKKSPWHSWSALAYQRWRDFTDFNWMKSINNYNFL